MSNSSSSRVLGTEAFKQINQARLLVVGAGGIGCELLKNLVLSGFQNIEVIDLDTIDVSNLNRQFLFRREHVGQSKALVARDSVLQFNPRAAINLVAHHGNIKSSQFDLAFFERFDLVLNALDNVDARRHVNRMCLAADRPLIESGTQGYLGQVFAIRKDVTECFECQPKPTTKSYAVCTIRNTPELPVHCVVWAKHILNALFGEKDEGNPLADFKLPELTSSVDASAARACAMAVFELLFVSEIEKQLQVAARWKERKAPLVLRFAELSAQCDDSDSQRPRQQRVLSVADYASEFVDSVVNIICQRSAQIGHLQFDKDDDLLMDFVACASNLRMFQYHIPMMSRFALKGIAGNIVHAIATTNAIAAGLIVLEAFKVLQGKFQQCRSSWIKRTGPKVLQPCVLAAPNPACAVCRKQTTVLRCDTNKLTLQQLYRLVLSKALALNDPDLDVCNRDNAIGVESECSAAYLQSPLSKVRIDDGAELRVLDQLQQYEANILVRHTEDLKEEQHPQGFELIGAEAALAAQVAAAETSQQTEQPIDDDVCVIEEPHADERAAKRRKLE